MPRLVAEVLRSRWPRQLEARLLAGELDMAVDNAINLEQAVELGADWEKRGLGAVLYSSLTWQATAFQLRPELVQSRQDGF